MFAGSPWLVKLLAPDVLVQRLGELVHVLSHVVDCLVAQIGCLQHLAVDIARIQADFVSILVCAFGRSAGMIFVRKHIDLSPANLLADRSHCVDVESVDQSPIQRGQAEQVLHAR